MENLSTAGVAYLILISFSTVFQIAWIFILSRLLYNGNSGVLWVSFLIPLFAFMCNCVGMFLILWIVEFTSVLDECENADSKDVCAKEGMLVGFFAIIALFLATCLHSFVWCFTLGNSEESEFKTMSSGLRESESFLSVNF
jgi:hypothetical protein